MGGHVDSTGWATLGVVVGMFTAASGLAQFATAMLTLTVGVIIAHFLKRELQYRFPPKKRAITEDAK
jgi:hypothetical protein